MFLIRSLGCRAVYLTLMLCVMADITALYRKILKNRTFSKESRRFHCGGRQSVGQYRWIEKIEVTVKEVAIKT